MWVTNEVFLWVNGILIASILAFLGSLWKMRGEILPLCQIGKRIQVNAPDNWLNQRGLGIAKLFNTKGVDTTHNSLSSEKVIERDNLITRGKSIGLSQAEATRLKELLGEDARNDFANGLLNLLAFLALLALIDAIIRGLSRE